MATHSELVPGVTPQRLAELRGNDPLVPETWIASAALAETPEQALDLVEQGLRHHPHNAFLVRMRLSLLQQLDRQGELRDAIANGLATGPSPQMQALLRSFRIAVLIDQGAPDEAEAECLRLGSVTDVPPDMVAAAWAETALAYEFIGRSPQADAALEHSLDLGAAGVPHLRSLTETRASRRAAVGALLARARERHPRHVDLHLFAAQEAMLDGELDSAQQLIDSIPGPAPARLAGRVEMLPAQLLLLRDQPRAALPVILARLDRYVADPVAIETLLACRSRFGVPDDEVMRTRLRTARRHLARDPILARRVDQYLAESAAPTSGD